MSSNEQKILAKIKAARSYYMKGNFEKAVELYRNVAETIADDPDNLPIIQIELGWSLYQVKNYQEAIRHLQAASRSDSLTTRQRFDCLRLTGFCYEMMGDLPRARQFLQEAILQELPTKDKRFAIFELGKIFFMENQYLESEHYFNMILDTFSEKEASYYFAIRYYLGFCAFYQKQYDKARHYFDRLIELKNDPATRVTGYFGLAHIHFIREQYSAVVDLCEKILKMDPQFFDKETLGYFLATAYLHLGNRQSAETFLNELETNYPGGRYASQYAKLRALLQRRNNN